MAFHLKFENGKSTSDRQRSSSLSVVIAVVLLACIVCVFVLDQAVNNGALWNALWSALLKK
jgi:hypothetical protein